MISLHAYDPMRDLGKRLPNGGDVTCGASFRSVRGAQEVSAENDAEVRQFWNVPELGHVLSEHLAEE